ncbi:hypothetical protein [Rhodoferax sp.]|uniref:hypothetical protein n=1 Tax=Rhodoferax sp. TaxID=50421 RepID=UPI0025E35B25|nr:hypothetical protein [Rhodoferax sp.]
MNPSRKSRLAQSLILAAALLCLAVSMACWFVYFTVYWPYRNLFDETGRYFDVQSSVVYQEQSGLLMWPALALSVLTILLGVAWLALRSASAPPI